MMNRTCWRALLCGAALLLGACGSSGEETSTDEQQHAIETPAEPPSPVTPAPPSPPEAPPVDEASTSHCHADENTVFSCRIADSQKMVSICASTDLMRDQGYLQYRFGRLGAVELAFPDALQNTQDAFMWQTIGYSGGWDTRIQFSNGGYAYQLYDQAFKVSISEKSLHGGIIILDGEAVIAHLHCDAATLGTPYTNSLNDLYEKIPEGVFFQE